MNVTRHGDVPVLFSPQWADAARDAVDRGPDEALRATKLDAYWEWIDDARAEYSGPWALGVSDLDGGAAYLNLRWDRGQCVEGSILRPSSALEPVQPDAAYVLAAQYEVWRDLLAGTDPGRVIMYRRMRLVRGDVLLFFRKIYFFIESLAAISRLPATLPKGFSENGQRV